MFKRAPIAVLAITLSGLLGTVLSGCGVPATQAPPLPPTRVLPSRVPVIATTDPNAGATATLPPTIVAVQPTNTPTRARPTLTPTITLIPPTSTPAPPTNTPEPTATRVPDPAAGETLFINGIPGKPEIPTCLSCHNVDPASTEVKTGPSMVGIARRAGERVLGQSPRTYLYNSIVKPNEYLVPNENNQVYAVGDQSLMYQNFAQDLTPDQVNDLVAYLLTLR